METQLTLEADQYIPYPLDEVAIDFEVQGETANNPIRWTYCWRPVGGRQSMHTLRRWSSRGLVPKVVDVEGYALERAFELMRAQKGIPERCATVAIADIGATMDDAVGTEARSGHLYPRASSSGGKQLTDEIMRRYGLPLAEAGTSQKTGRLCLRIMRSMCSIPSGKRWRNKLRARCNSFSPQATLTVSMP